MIADIRTAFTRKFGPLPAWAWLTILAGVVYLWRKRAAGTGTTGGATTDTSTADLTPPDPQDPVVLQPGESVYNPSTGELIGTAPEQQPPPDATTITPINDPVPPDTTVPDAPFMPSSAAPSVTPTKKPSALDRAKAAVTRGRVGPINRQRLARAGYTPNQVAYHARRKTPLGKPKPQHKPPKPVKHPTATKPRTRGAATIKHNAPHAKPKPASKPPKPRPKPPAAKAPAATARPRPTVVAKPVVRQRPAPAPTHSTPRKKK